MIEFISSFLVYGSMVLIIAVYCVHRKMASDEEEEEISVIRERKYIPKFMVPILTTRNNIHIKQMESECGAHIRILYDERAEDKRLIPCLLSGFRENLDAAHALLDSWIEDARNQVTDEIWIPTEILGHIIGKRGKKIKALIRSSRVDIKVRNPKSGSIFSHLKIIGTAEGIENAKTHIKGLIDLHLTKGVMKLIDKRRIAAIKKKIKKRRRRNK